VSSSPKSPADRAKFVVAWFLLGFAVFHWLSFSVGSGRLTSFDAGWHLATGRWILEHGSVPRVDPFCYTSSGLDWVNINWLAQIVLYRLYTFGGAQALCALKALLLGVCVFFAWLNLRVRRAPPLLGLVGLALVFYSLTYVTQVRPRLFTFALLSFFAWVLARPDEDDRFHLGWAGLLLLLLLVWNHLHGGFVYGYAVLATDAAGTAYASWRARRQLFPRRALLLTGAIVVGLSSFAFHPHGFEAPWHVANYVSRLGKTVIEMTVELSPFDFNDRLGRYAEFCLAAGVIGCFWGRRPSARDLLPTIPLLHLMLLMKRGVNPLALTALPWVALTWTPLWSKVPRRSALDRLLSPFWRGLGPAILVATLVGTVAPALFQASPGIPNDSSTKTWDQSLIPVEAMEAIRRTGGEGRIFHNYWIGGLADWAFYPSRRSHSDGRGDFHGQGTAFRENQAIISRHVGWHERLIALEVEFVLVKGRSNIAHYLQEPRLGWTRIHEDRTWVVLRRPR